MKYFKYGTIGTLGLVGIFAVASTHTLAQPAIDQEKVSVLDVSDFRVAGVACPAENELIAEIDEEVIFAGCASIF